MKSDLSWPILLAGFGRVVIWWFGALHAYWRKRWAVCAGFTLAGFNAIVLGLYNAHSDLAPDWLTDLAAIMQAPAAALIVLGFIAARPRHTSRPRRWTP